jgi:AcrR family transcriptional regulator
MSRPARRTRARPAGRAAPAPRVPPQRLRLDVDDRRDRLLALGLALFSERSYDAVSVDDVARAAGISKGLLYHYFPTKRAFYVAALRAAAHQLRAETVSVDPAATPEEQVRRALQTYLGFVDRRGAAYVALMRGGIGSDAEVAEVLEETRSAFLAFLAQLVERLLPETPGPLVQVAMRGWIGFVEVTSIDWVAHRTVPLQQLVVLAQMALFDAVRAAAQLSSPHSAGHRRDHTTHKR